jgi:AmmeMemoRadiSam system protein A
MRGVPSIEAERPLFGTASTPTVDAEARAALLELARVALVVATGGAGPAALRPALDRIPSDLERGVVFVTLTEGGTLRGCMGILEPTRNLGDAVVTAAITAALDDPRFLPVTASELPAIHVEISVLGRQAPISEPDSFEPGVDGVLVERNGRRGLLLPEVATTFGWGAPQMFEAVCQKAGLPDDAWRDPGTRLWTFRTVRFGGPAVPTG